MFICEVKVLIDLRWKSFFEQREDSGSMPQEAALDASSARFS